LEARAYEHPGTDHGEHAEPDAWLTVPEAATLRDLVFAGAALHDAVERADTEVAGDTTRPAARAPIFSVIYLLCYSSAAIPALIAGQLTNTFSLPQIALGYSALALIATLFTAIGARNPQPNPTRNSQPVEQSRA
jgi:hypothetical protein